MASLPLPRRRALAGAALLLVALVLGGRYVTGARTAAVEAPEPARLERVADAARPLVVVHVVGAVRRPGLYRFREGARIADAVRRAGGVTRNADVTAVNLAAPLADGAQVVVPARAAPGVATAPAASSAGGPSAPISLSTATLDQLDELPGIGPTTAQKILDYREQHGAFSSVDELDAVSGIGPSRLEELRKHVVP